MSRLSKIRHLLKTKAKRNFPKLEFKMILEGIVTTTNIDGSVNVSPMGPMVESESFDKFILRPFKTSTTYKNIKRTSCGVLHVTDNVELFACGAIRQFDSPPPTRRAAIVDGSVLVDCCRYFEFKVQTLNDTEDRTEISCEVVECRDVRPFFGFNRAKHAVLEAAILATRIHLIDQSLIVADMDRLRIIIDKTAGEQEKKAFLRIESFLNENGFTFD